MADTQAEQIAVALNVLLWLHEMETDDGALRDEISHVRDRLHEWIELLEGQEV